LNDLNPQAVVLAIAAVLDYCIGDPWNWLHPVQVMGWAIQSYTKACLQRWQNPRMLKLAGIGLAIGLIGGSGAIGWLIVQAARWIHPWVGVGIESVLLASCLAGRSLRAAAEEVLQPLAQGDLPTARRQLSRYVGRDTDSLSEAELLRAILETVTENATDGVMAPLFFALLGSFLPIGAVPLALAYKAASTLDSMVGYREAPYLNLGWASARIEDGLTWLPCRLTVLTLALLSGRPLHVLALCWRDAPQDPSPNAGWSECAYAAVLGVQMGGTNQYKGVIKFKPLLGNCGHPIKPEVIEQATRLTRRNVLIWLAIGLTAHWILNYVA
jgi:adenosylcobinamide-phosphate synthase